MFAHKATQKPYVNMKEFVDYVNYIHSIGAIPGDPPKVRAIYASMMTLQFIKMMISFPMVDHLMNKEHAFIARDYAVHTGGLHRLQREFNPFETYISLDFLKFDKRMPFELIDQVRHLCRNLSDQ